MEILIILVCLLLNGLFAAYEMAFVAVSKSQLRAMVRQGNGEARSLLRLRESPERVLSVVQVGITFVGAIAAAVGGVGAAEILEPYFLATFGISEAYAESLAVIAVVLPITYLNVVVGELVPKTLALKNPAKIALLGVRWLSLADTLLGPVVGILEWSTKRLLKLFSFWYVKHPDQAQQTAVEIDSLSPAHQKIVLNMVEIEKKRVKDIYLPWQQVIHVKVTDSIEHVHQLVLSSGHTRLPVTDDQQVVGVLHTKEFLAAKESGAQNWNALVRQALRVKSTDPAFGVLRLMQDKRSHLAMVYSPEGGLFGIVTLEDVLEEVVGDIFDEDDDGRVRKVLASKARSKINDPALRLRP